MIHEAELIGTVNYSVNKYKVYRAAGRHDNANPWYYGIAFDGAAVPYCAYASLRSLFAVKFGVRVEFKPVEGYDGPRL